MATARDCVWKQCPGTAALTPSGYEIMPTNAYKRSNLTDVKKANRRDRRIKNMFNSLKQFNGFIILFGIVYLFECGHGEGAVRKLKTRRD